MQIPWEYYFIDTWINFMIAGFIVTWVVILIICFYLWNKFKDE